MKLSTSILSCKNRLKSINELNETSTDYIHLDIMDGKFVNNKQFSIKEIININRISTKPLDIHLMVNKPIKYIKKIKSLNIEYITFHLEQKQNINSIINMVKKNNYKVGISLKPNTDIDMIIPYLDNIDMVLLMSVEPGLGGQSFLVSTLSRITRLKKIIGDRKIVIQVDGGINDTNINLLKENDVDLVVVGSYIINSNDYQRQIDKIK